MVRTLIFDWDGTLHNTEHLYGSAFRAAYAWLVSEGYAPERVYTDREVSIYLGMNAVVMWNTFMPRLPQPVKEQASALIGEHMVAEVRAGKAVLYPGAPETLEKFKRQGYHLVFLSNCKRAYLEAHRAQFGLARWFDGFYCCQDYGFRPKKEIFPFVARDFPGDYLMIGDRYSDLEVGYAHGLRTIACTYGFGQPSEWEGADRLAAQVTELPGLVEELTEFDTLRCGDQK